MTGKKLNMTEACRQRYRSVVEAIQELLQNTEETKPLLIAIDGDAASGKTTLGFYLQEIFSAFLLTFGIRGGNMYLTLNTSTEIHYG